LKPAHHAPKTAVEFTKTLQATLIVKDGNIKVKSILGFTKGFMWGLKNAGFKGIIYYELL